MRLDGRSWDQLRSITIEPQVNRYAEGSCIIRWGHNQILCTVSFESPAPKFAADKSQGWVTAEYSLLPRSVAERVRRDKALSGGRSQEISRLIGRSLRSACDLSALGNHQFIVDCDVLQADGGTRCAAITGGWVALALAFEKLRVLGILTQFPLRRQVAALSFGVHSEGLLLDLDYQEDSQIIVDGNVVFDHQGQLVEVQVTGEQGSLGVDNLMQAVTTVIEKGRILFEIQRQALAQVGFYWPS